MCTLIGHGKRGKSWNLLFQFPGLETDLISVAINTGMDFMLYNVVLFQN